MVKIKGRYYFGFWEPVYGEPHDSELELQSLKNAIDRNWVIQHIEQMEDYLASAQIADRYTGEMFNAGFYRDGDFVFSTDFFRYYKAGHVGLPLEYEDYLKQVLASQSPE